MIKWLIIIGSVMVLIMFPFLRWMLFHPVTSGRWAFTDIFDYIKHKRYNECKAYGQVFMFTASDSQAFGSGKTLSMVRWVRNTYKHYNGLPVWDENTKSFVNQRIIVISNVQFNDIPYIPFIGRDQFVQLDKLPHTEHDILLFVIDEAGMEFNSRSYKDNLPTSFLVKLLQVRHNKVALAMTSQRFTFVDKILRQICGVVTTCKKKWRLVRLQDYDAYTLENAQNPELIQPIATRYYFAKNDLFSSYDTTYNVEQLKRQLEDGDLLTTEEILARLGDSGNPEVAKPRWRRRYRQGRR